MELKPSWQNKQKFVNQQWKVTQSDVKKETKWIIETFVMMIRTMMEQFIFLNIG